MVQTILYELILIQVHQDVFYSLCRERLPYVMEGKEKLIKREPESRPLDSMGSVIGSFTSRKQIRFFFSVDQNRH